MHEHLVRGSVALLKNRVSYLKNYEDLSSGMIQIRLSKGSVPRLKNRVLYLKNYDELCPGIMQNKVLEEVV